MSRWFIAQSVCTKLVKAIVPETTWVIILTVPNHQMGNEYDVNDAFERINCIVPKTLNERLWADKTQKTPYVYENQKTES